MSSSSLRTDTASRFCRIVLTEQESTEALRHVSPLLLAYLQNKIEAYAHELVGRKLPYHADPKQQVDAILALEDLRTRIDAYEELLSEILAAQQQ